VQRIHEPHKNRVVYEEGDEEEAALELIEEGEGAKRIRTQLTDYFELNSDSNRINRATANKYRYDTIHEEFWWDLRNKRWIERTRDRDKLVRVATAAPGNREQQVRLIIVYLSIQ
jgi:hypothetical protein